MRYGSVPGPTSEEVLDGLLETGRAEIDIQTSRPADSFQVDTFLIGEWISVLQITYLHAEDFNIPALKEIWEYCLL